ncbi:MAG TPA: hypothetical protein PLL69_10105, partial [Gemmatimonadales bacterium]|nr:hypothetical protein [Gemmatimonadales bacterium]
VQLRSAADAELRVQLTLEPVQRRGGQGVRISYLLPVEAGLNAVHREIDASHLDAGSYTLRIAVARHDGTVVEQRSSGVVLR